MLLVQKPVPIPMSPSTSHRRHPSAPPAIIVQPTKVPGILSISKPLLPRQHQPPRHPQRTTKTRPSTRSFNNDISSIAPDIILPPLVEKPSSPPATPIPVKPPRGRQTKPPKDKGPTRSSSNHGHSRRNNVRQPSPPIHSSQVEGPTLSPAPSFPNRITNPAANSFDPFVLSSDSDSDNARPQFLSNNAFSKSFPTLPPPPPPKTARRRNNTSQPSTPTPAPRPVPVPRGKPTHRTNLSRSAPTPQVLPRVDKRRASATFTMDFPVCDDTTDVEDHSIPSTPTREFTADTALHHFSFYAPRTAPLFPSSGFPFGHSTDSTPSPTRLHYHHHRTPSEGVFNMSLDEDMSSTSDASEELKKLFGFPPKRFGSVGPSATRAGKDKAGFFASSVFQNSPSPDELPPPAF